MNGPRSANLHILTGSFGVGKTTILDNIGAGVRCVGEPAREIIAEQRAINGAAYDPAPSLFVELLLQRSIEKHEAAQAGDGPVLFDRGVPDCIAYAAHRGRDVTSPTLASERYRYNREVLLLEPWEEIYTTDDLRTLSFAPTLAFHEALVEAYQRTGYTLVPVPRGSVDDRTAFVRGFIIHGGAG
jgi:predicted ATPase